MDLRHFNVRRVAEVLEGNEAYPLSCAGERSSWGEIALRVGEAATGCLAELAAEDGAAPLEALPASFCFYFKRTGRREGYEDTLRSFGPRSLARPRCRYRACGAGAGV